VAAVSLREMHSPDNWGFQAPQSSAIATLADHLTRSLPTSVNTVLNVTYDGSNRLLSFEADGFLYLFDYPDSTHITLSINGDIKQLTLDGSGRITQIVSL
jgi:hypothetical protein